MDKFYEWVIMLVALSVLSLLMDLCLPQGMMRKYARFVLGLLILAAIATPLWSILNTLPSSQESSNPSIVSTVRPHTIQEYMDFYKKQVLPDWNIKP